MTPQPLLNECERQRVIVRHVSSATDTAHRAAEVEAMTAAALRVIAASRAAFLGHDHTWDPQAR